MTVDNTKGRASTIDYDQVVQSHATRWHDADAAASYASRPPYGDELFELLVGLVIDEPRRVLDVGCGTGKISRVLSTQVDQVDALDFAPQMIAEGKRLPSGDSERIRWIVGRAEDAQLAPPYALIVGGESVHWMDWDVVLPRFARSLTPNGMLAIARVDDTAPAPWREGLLASIKRYSTQQAWRPFDMITAWTKVGLYQPIGSVLTKPFAFEQSVEAFIDAQHAMSSLTRAHIDADTFDSEIRALLAPYCPDGTLRREIRAGLEWGKVMHYGTFNACRSLAAAALVGLREQRRDAIAHLE